MRLPNGFGSVYKLQGHRRRPWVVKKTIEGRQKALGYFETHDEALTFLLKVNHEPRGLTATFADIYQQWQVAKWPTISKSSQQAYDISFGHLSRLHDKTMSRLKYLDLQEAMDDVRKVAGYSTQKKCRVLMSQLYQYAIKREMASTDYSRYVEIDRHHPVYKKRPFTVREINRLWRASDSDVVQDVLILIYTGLRIGEYLALRPQDIKIRERYLDIRHSKTEAGIRRVPISKKILPFLEARKDRRSICLSPTYDSFRRRFDSTLKQLSMHHSPHECRHTLASMLDSAGVNDTTVKMILGHARRGVTKAVYTHKTLRELRKAVDIL
ncbi:site-specific integrase [Acidaminococcus timonensis]|uniref:tyrosine-type recombinase/integrase n=1 Tax=Acidaminococcus timonensis TaxID=1871002 RepID=UPI003076A61A